MAWGWRDSVVTHIRSRVTAASTHTPTPPHKRRESDMLSELESLISTEVSKAKAISERTHTIKLPPTPPTREAYWYDDKELTIRPITTRRFYDLVDQCASADGTTDQTQFMFEVIGECLVDPNLQNPELQRALGVGNAREVIERIFPEPFILRDIRARIEDISGFGTTGVEFRESP